LVSLDDSDPHATKPLLHKISADGGMPISINPVSVNPCFSILDTLDWDSYLAEENDSNQQKQTPVKTSADSEILTHFKSVIKNVSTSIRLNIRPFPETSD
jgi:hypothetical protein